MTELYTSSLIQEQLPSYVQEEYPKFALFLEKYYEWLQSNFQVLNAIQKFAESKDMDLANDFYLNLIKRELSPYFPEEIILNKKILLKFINQYYSVKGTPQSLKFLFKILYNEDISIYYPKEDILKVSDGKWVRPLALRIDTEDNNIFNLVGVKITGQQSKATAIVESVTRSIDRQLGIEYIEMYISNINRLFTTGEIVYGTYINNGSSITVEGRLIGSLSEIRINPQFRGLFYNGFNTDTGYEGDPVTIIGGLNPTSGNPIGALATVGDTTKGSVIEVAIVDGGFGFRDPAVNINSSIIDFVGGFENTIFGQESRASISLIDLGVSRIVNVSNTAIETIYSLTLDGAANTSNIENCNISFINTNQTLNVYPIAYVVTDGSGGGYRSLPDANFYSLYMEEYDDNLIISATSIIRDTNTLRDNAQDLTVSFEPGDLIRIVVTNKFEEIRVVDTVTTDMITVKGSNFENDLGDVKVFKMLRRPLNELGALGRINIIDGGENYNVGENLIFTSYQGYGANAYVSAIHLANNGIKEVTFRDDGSLIKGGEGYSNFDLPIITIDTASGSNAILQVSEVLGSGVDAELFTTRIGSISTIRVVSYGYDYVSAPTISLRNADLTVSNVTEGQLFVSNTRIYQGVSNVNTTFSALIDSYDPDTNLLRIFNYRGELNTSNQIISDTDPPVLANVISIVYYGDGKARALATFENGLIRYPGIYLNTDGQPSSDKKIQDDKKYHNYSYLITTENDYAKFKKTLNEVVHPVGTKTFVNRINPHTENTTNVNVSIEQITIRTLANTFNVQTNSNVITATGLSANLVSQVNVGDTLIVKNLVKSLNGTVNVVSSSNTVTGNGTNFINDLYDGITINLSTGNTDAVLYVSDANSFITQNTINVTANNVLINVIIDEVKTVSSVNANTIILSDTLSTNGSFVTVILQKIE